MLAPRLDDPPRPPAPTTTRLRLLGCAALGAMASWGALVHAPSRDASDAAVTPAAHALAAEAMKQTPEVAPVHSPLLAKRGGAAASHGHAPADRDARPTAFERSTASSVGASADVSAAAPGTSSGRPWTPAADARQGRPASAAVPYQVGFARPSPPGAAPPSPVQAQMIDATDQVIEIEEEMPAVAPAADPPRAPLLPSTLENSELDERWSRETADPRWSSEITEYLHETAAAAGLPPSVVQDTDCATTLCRVELRFDDLGSAGAFQDLAQNPDIEYRGDPVSTDSGVSVVLYVARPRQAE